MLKSNIGARRGTNGGLRMIVGDLRARAGRSLADALAEALREAVRDGRLPAGTPLPASRTLAADLQVSRGVVVRAYEQLVAEGYLRAHVGRGTVVGELPGVTAPAVPSTDRVLPASPGLPALGMFPRREWLRALETALREVPDAELGYGDPRGHPRLRAALAAYLGRTRAVVAAVDHIVVTSGFAQAIRLVAEALARHGIDTVGVEEPGSVGVAETVRSAGLTTRPVPVDADGVDVAALGDLRAVIVTPAHQFPTGAVLAPARRTALLEWAATGDGVVVEDDYDAEYRYDRAPVGALQGLAPERVVYGGSVSKTLAPGLRLGWVVAPPWLSPALVEAKFAADIATPVLDQVALAVLLETGALDRHIRRTASRYAARRQRLLAAVERHLPGWRATGIAAGLHAVLLPDRAPPPDVLAAAAAAARPLLVTPLAAFARREPAPAGLVVGYGAATPHQIDAGVAAAAAVLTRR